MKKYLSLYFILDTVLSLPKCLKQLQQGIAYAELCEELWYMVKNGSGDNLHDSNTTLTKWWINIMLHN